MIKVEIQYASRIFEKSLPETTSVEELKKKMQSELKLAENRQRLETLSDTGLKIALKNDQKLIDFKSNVKDGKLILNCKDLGTQIEYNYLFYIEYCFPPLSVLFFFFLFISRVSKYHVLLTFCVVFHFAKRLLETKYVHIFSTPSVPFKVLLRNCAHYWVLIGVILPIEVFVLRTPTLTACCCSSCNVAVFLLFELGNFYCHFALRKMREEKQPDGSIKITMSRKVPSGLFFDWLISPNYTFEILAWLTFAILFNSVTAVVFLVLSSVIMTQWAIQKKKRYLTGDLSPAEKIGVKKRYATLPFII